MHNVDTAQRGDAKGRRTKTRSRTNRSLGIMSYYFACSLWTSRRTMANHTARTKGRTLKPAIGLLSWHCTKVAISTPPFPVSLTDLSLMSLCFSQMLAGLENRHTGKKNSSSTYKWKR